MNKNIFSIAMLVLVLPVTVFALTKPAPDADLESYSYVFYLYYDNGQLFADRDYEIKFDIINERTPVPSPTVGDYKLEIINFKSEIVKSQTFNPRPIGPNSTSGKIQVKAPYVSNGQRAVFYDNQGKQLVTIFIQGGSLCNDDGSCDSGAGENDKTCTSDCGRATPRPTISAPPVISDEGPDIMTIVIYAVGGLGVVVLAWFGWKWWQKRREGNFLPPPSSSPLPPSPPLPPPPLG